VSAGAPRRIAYTGEQSRRGYHMTKLFASLTDPAARAAFKADPDGAMRAAGFSDAEIALVHAREFNALLERGVAIYALGKAGRALGFTLVDAGARMRGETVEAFLASRPLALGTAVRG